MAARSFAETANTFACPAVARVSASPTVGSRSWRGDRPALVGEGSSTPSKGASGSVTDATALPVSRLSQLLLTMPCSAGDAPVNSVACPGAVSVMAWVKRARG